MFAWNEIDRNEILEWFLLLFRPTNDDVDVLKRELISVQQRMNEMSLEKEQQIEPLRDALHEMFVFAFNRRFSLHRSCLVMNLSNDLINLKLISIKCVRLFVVHPSIFFFFIDNLNLRWYSHQRYISDHWWSQSNQTSPPFHSSKQRQTSSYSSTNTRLFAWSKSNLFQGYSLIFILLETHGNRSIETNKYSITNWSWSKCKQCVFIDYSIDFVFQKENNEQLTHRLEAEEKQTNSYRTQIETLTADIHQYEETIEELKQEKSQILWKKIEGENPDDNEEQQNLLRQLTQEKVWLESLLLFVFNRSVSLKLGSIWTTNERSSKTNETNQQRKRSIATRMGKSFQTIDWHHTGESQRAISTFFFDRFSRIESISRRTNST